MVDAWAIQTTSKAENAVNHSAQEVSSVHVHQRLFSCIDKLYDCLVVAPVISSSPVPTQEPVTTVAAPTTAASRCRLFVVGTGVCAW